VKENSIKNERSSIEEDIEELKRLLYSDKLSQYGKRKLINYYEQQEKNYKRVLEMNEVLLKENENLESENSRLKVIRYSREYGTENIYLITKSDLVQIDINKYMIEIEDGKFVDLKQIYQENEELKDKYATFVKMSSEVIANSIPVQKVKDKIEKLQKGPLKINENNKYYYETEAYNKIIIQVLQELIESEE
jgi:hypothetical protein